MEVLDSDDFFKMAKNYIYKSVHLRGDSFREMDDINLLNTIGMAFGYEIILPANDEEKTQADEGTYFMFTDEAKKHISMVFDQIKKSSSVTVRLKLIPLALYREEKMFQIPLFCIATIDGNRFVDDFGRLYRNVEDWKNNNCLPAGLLAYPNNLRMNKHMFISIMNTPETIWKRIIWNVVDGYARFIGIVSVIPGIIIPRGQIIALGVLIYGIGRSASKLYDRKIHNQSINIRNSEARQLWLSILNSSFNIVSIGVLWKISKLANEGKQLTSCIQNIIDILNCSSVVFNGATIINDSVYLLCNWNDIPNQQKFIIFAQMAFFSLNTFAFRLSDQVVKQFRENAISDMLNKLLPEDLSKAMLIRHERGDMEFLNLINHKVQAFGLNIELAIDCMTNSPKFSSTTPDLISKSEINTIGICLNTLTKYAGDKLSIYIKNGKFLELEPIIKDFPEMVLEYAEIVIKKIQIDYNAGDYAKLFASFLGLLFRSYITMNDKTVRELNKQQETASCYQSLDHAFERLDITDQTNVNHRVWEMVLEKFNQQNATELYNTIKNFRVLNSLVGSHPLYKDKSEEQLLELSKNLTKESLLLIIEKARILFGSEAAAIYHLITEGLACNLIVLEKYIIDANEFICENNFNRLEVKNGYRFCYYERAEPIGRAVVSEYNGYIRLCSYKFLPMD